RHTRSKRDWSSDVCSSDLGQCSFRRDRVARGHRIDQLQELLLDLIVLRHSRVAVQCPLTSHRNPPPRAGLGSTLHPDVVGCGGARMCEGPWPVSTGPPTGVDHWSSEYLLSMPSPMG